MDDITEVPVPTSPDYTALTADVVSAYVSKNPVRPTDLPELLRSVYAALHGLNQGSATDAAPVEKLTAAQIRKSITPDALISFLDGKPYKTLKRHLTGNGLTFDEYRERFGLPRDYPSVAASYSETRSALAKSLGLGQQRRKASKPAETVSEKPKGSGRSRKAKEAAEA